jgi:ornithine carbamoyltransferase
MRVPAGREAAEDTLPGKRWLPDQAENRLHAQKGLLAWPAEQE